MATAHEVNRAGTNALKPVVFGFWLVVLLIGLPETWPIYLLSFHIEVEWRDICFIASYSFDGTPNFLTTCSTLSYACGCGCCAGFQCCTAFLFACPTDHVKEKCLAGHQLVDIHLSSDFV